MNQAGFPSLIEQPRRWDVIAGFMLEQRYTTFVEVGCKEGRTTGHVLKTVPDSRVIAVDPWAQMPQQEGVEGGETYKEWDFAKIEAEFWENVGANKDRVLMLRDTSAGAWDWYTQSRHLDGCAFDPSIATDTCDCWLGRNPIDLVFIDAAHDYASVKEDIHRWWPIVRDGGMLIGHDYNHKWPGVERAVAECLDLMVVGCAPDSLWFVIKSPYTKLRAA
jgi:hypothetical protein